MSAAPRIWAVMPAAGTGTRMNAPLPKQYLTLGGKPVISYALETFARAPSVAGVVVAVAADDVQWEDIKPDLGKPLYRAPGGETRMHSVTNALRFLLERTDAGDWALVHDAARPCLTDIDLERLIAALYGHPVGGILGVPIADTVKRVRRGGAIVETLDRSELWRAFTPQMFRLGALYEALSDAAAQRVHVTDEAAAMERMGLVPRMVEGRPGNIKITHPHDLALAEFYLTHP